MAQRRYWMWASLLVMFVAAAARAEDTGPTQAAEAYLKDLKANAPEDHPLSSWELTAPQINGRMASIDATLKFSGAGDRKYTVILLYRAQAGEPAGQWTVSRPISEALNTARNRDPFLEQLKEAVGCGFVPAVPEVSPTVRGAPEPVIYVADNFTGNDPHGNPPQRAMPQKYPLVVLSAYVVARSTKSMPTIEFILDPKVADPVKLPRGEVISLNAVQGLIVDDAAGTAWVKAVIAIGADQPTVTDVTYVLTKKDRWKVDFAASSLKHELFESVLNKATKPVAPPTSTPPPPVVKPETAVTPITPETPAPAPEQNVAPAAPAPKGAGPSTAILLSIYKPIIMLIVFGAWAWIVSRMDKDMAFYYLPREAWNGVQIGAASLALLLWLVIPWFWIGIFPALLSLAGGIGGYAFYRNTKVPAGSEWKFDLAEKVREKAAKAEAKRAEQQAGIRLLQKDNAPITVPSGEDPEVVPHQALEQVLLFALERKAERIDLTIAPPEVAVVVVIDGVKFKHPAPDAKAAVALVDYVKKHAEMDLADRRRKQTGEIRVDADTLGKHTLGVTSFGSTRELNLSLRIDPRKTQVLKLDRMGFLDSQLQVLEPVIKAGKGLVLVSCPHGHGMTTCLYSFLSQHDPYTQTIVTLEEDIAFEIEGVTHNRLDSSDSSTAGNTAQRLTVMLRQDPQVLMLSRVHDAETAQTLARAAATLRLYAGISQQDTFTALQAFVKAAGDPGLASRGLAAIVSPRLIRKLCVTCRVPYTPDPAVFKKLNLRSDRVGAFYKHSGKVMVKDKPQTCPTCLGIGYQGRTAVFEVMILDAPARELIAHGQLDQLRAHLRKQKMLLLQEAALVKVVDGITSISEVTRAFGKET